jgi:hypothetical protein
MPPRADTSSTMPSYRDARTAAHIHQGGLDLGGAQAMAGDVDHVVDTAGDPVIAVGVAPAAR